MLNLLFHKLFIFMKAAKKFILRSIFLVLVCIYMFSCEDNESIENSDNNLITTDFAPRGTKWYFSQGFALSENV